MYNVLVMDRAEYEEIYSRLAKERRVLENRRAEMEAALADISKQIESLQETMSNLSPLAGYTLFEDSLAKLGITDATRKVLSLERDVWMSVSEIKTKMIDLGYDFSKYSAPDASIHTTLKRLVEAEKAESKKEEWRIFYKFKEMDDDIPF
jgi:hypothetical protein